MVDYDFKLIETKWQNIWREKNAFAASDDFSKQKYYVLVEFPCPSGEGLHIGHPRSYVALDVVARKRRMEGYNVLYPMGWDAFGLPTENYAIKTGQHPRDITRRNVTNFKRQMNQLGLSFDWSREINTTEPEYYKWTQWIFLKMWEHGLAYKAEVPVNWCESCKVGLANEEVVGGTCERCGGTVTLRMKQQWLLRITAYADRLLKDLDSVDYMNKIKSQQVNWIGRSEGAEINFALRMPDTPIIRVFTTRPDTLYGVTYLALSPQHELVDKILPFCENEGRVHDYVESLNNKTTIEHGGNKDDISGVELKGVMAINPANNRAIPIWLSDYVLSSYGTGAIMAVPAHDDRDWRFAKKHGLPVIEVISGGNVEDAAFTEIDNGIMVNSGALDGMKPGEAISRIISIVQREGYGKPAVQYKLRDWVFSRQRFWGEPIPMIHCESCGWVPVPESEIPIRLPEVERYQSTATGESPLALIEDWVNTNCPRCGGSGKRETDTMPQWAGSSWYFLRYCDPHNDKMLVSPEKLSYWMPVDWYNGGMEHTTLHLLYSRFWHKFLYDIGIVPTEEPYKKRTSHGLILGENNEKMSKSRGNVVNPDDLVKEYGSDALRLFEVFIGEYEEPIPWSTKGLIGMSRFLHRVWKIQNKVGSYKTDSETTRLVHRTIRDVTDRIERMKFNTAVSALMELANHFNNLNAINRSDWETFLKLLSPFAPFIAEELWAELGKPELLCVQSWPAFDPLYIDKNIVDVPIQVNGKLRKKIQLPSETSDAQVKGFAMQALETAIDGDTISRIIVARTSSGMIVNIVTRK